jgi:hypothetical protein
VELEAQLGALRAEVDEGIKTTELLEAELKRYRYSFNVGQPNCPERVPTGELQLAFERVLAGAPPANDLVAQAGSLGSVDEDASSAAQPGHSGTPQHPDGSKGKRTGTDGKRTGHGRRNLDLSNLPTEVVRIDPPEVTANPEEFELIGEETSSRVGYRACYLRLVFVRTKWVKKSSKARVTQAATANASVDENAPQAAQAQAPTVRIAALPPNVLPHVMADASAIANVVTSKYDDVLPLNRQERISTRHGFHLPRSTQCGWLSVAFALLHRIVLAMFAESKAQAFCIATDATGAPVQKVRGCRKWHVFTFIADNGHIVFRWVNEHSGKAIASLLSGFRGHLLSDAAPIYAVLQRELGITLVYCWAHVRRGFWRALHTDKDLATEALSIISKLFQLESECKLIPMPARTAVRAERARLLLELFDGWIARHQDRKDIGEPLQKAIGYYINQRDGLRRFLEDGRLSIHNNGCEGQLRNLAMGRDNWRYFLNRTGLNWYTTFRSLIASCHLHGINPQIYLEEVLRLAPHWPATQVLLLSPKYWPLTRAGLSPEQMEIIRSPWAATTTPATELDELAHASDPTSQHRAA